MRLTDLLSLSHVPRWSIVRHSNPQSVADHTFRTMVIFTELSERLGIPYESGDLIAVLTHDADECRTGDISGPAKRGGVSVAPPPVWCPWMGGTPTFSTPTVRWMFKLADMIEAMTFIEANGLGPHAVRAAAGLSDQIDVVPWVASVREIVFGLINDIRNETDR